MRIDPVFLVAPEPEPPSMPTRRAFLLAAGALVVGAGGGGACGYSLGVAARPVEPAADKPVAEPSSGDAELDYWRGVAKGPLDDLFEKGLMFLHVRNTDYQQDQQLWLGVQRLAEEVRDNPAREVDEGLLALLAAVIDGPARPAEPSLRSLVPVLRERRQALRRKK
jgi:hypothetical protein